MMKLILSFFACLFLGACATDMVEPERDSYGNIIYDANGCTQYKMTDKHPMQKLNNKMAAAYEKKCGKKLEINDQQPGGLDYCVKTARQY